MTQGESSESLFFMNEATRQFIQQHRMDDVRQLALKGGGRLADVDMPLALQQIAGWQTARKKLPSWAEVEGLMYPPHLNMEQCSSEETAIYKAKLSVFNAPCSMVNTLVDLTGGLGVDFSFMSRPFSKRVYVERNPELCELARHNFKCLGLEAEVVCTEAEDYLRAMAPVDVLYLDPARRDEHGSRTYGIEDCTPNVIELLPLLFEKSRRILLKLSPMLDWHKAVCDLQKVSEVHIISVGNECKELLLVLENNPPEHLTITCVNDDSIYRIVSLRETGSFITRKQEFHYEKLRVCSGRTTEPLFLFEPNASIMKAGCFMEVGDSFGINQLSPNSHLFVSDREVVDFPGRRFRVDAVSSMNKQELKAALKGVERANVAVRNFPLTAESLRKKLRLKDGGEVFIFGTTLSDGSHQLFICRKIG